MSGWYLSVFRTVMKICKFLGLPDPEPDPLVGGVDPVPVPDPDHFMNKQKY
jgi:hypothetical protein